MTMFRIVQMIYEMAIPTVIKSIRKTRQLTNQTPDFLSLIEKTQEFLEVCQYWCVKSLMEFVEVAIQETVKVANMRSTIVMVLVVAIR